jgi:hypothetical protein
MSSADVGYRNPGCQLKVRITKDEPSFLTYAGKNLKEKNIMDQKQTNPKGTERKNDSGTTDLENDLLEQDIDEDENEESVEGEEELQGDQQKKQNRGEKEQGLDKKRQNPNNPNEQQHSDNIRKREDVFQQRDTKTNEETFPRKNPKNQSGNQGNRK